MWCKTLILPIQFQYVISFYHIFKNKHNYIELIQIPIYKSNQIKTLLKCY